MTHLVGSAWYLATYSAQKLCLIKTEIVEIRRMGFDFFKLDMIQKKTAVDIYQ